MTYQNAFGYSSLLELNVIWSSNNFCHQYPSSLYFIRVLASWLLLVLGSRLRIIYQRTIGNRCCHDQPCPRMLAQKCLYFLSRKCAKYFLNFFKKMLDLDQFLLQERIFLIFQRHQVFISLSTTYVRAAINMTVLNICRAPQQHLVIRQWD